MSLVESVEDLEKRTISKVKWRLLPFCLLLYIINGIDRNNLGFAAMEMNTALEISSVAFGMLSSAFFVSYFLFEVPSNIAMHRIGARIWMARIMVSWGLVTIGMFFVQNFTHVFTLRFLLGAAEAGFFPGMIYYFTYWFPAKERASITAIFMLSAPIGTLLGAPVATWIMDNIHWLDHPGWRWLFIIEGVPAIFFGVITYFYLTNKVEDAKWLTPEERTWLSGVMAREAKLKEESAHLSLSQVFAHRRVWRLAFIYMTIQVTTQTVAFWMPSFVKEFSQAFSNSDVGLIMMGPGILGAIGMLYWGRHSDKSKERVYHTAIPMLVSGLGMVMIATSGNVYLKILGLTLNGIGNVCFYGPFWSLPTVFLTSEAAAVGVAIINSCSSFGGFAGSNIIGLIKSSSLGTNGVLYFQAACCVIAFLLTITLRVKDTALTGESTQQGGKSVS